MKKAITIACLLFFSTLVFANVEIDSVMYGTFYNNKSLTITNSYIEGLDGTTYQEQVFAFGGQDEFSFFFSDEAKKFETGLGVFVNVDFLTTIYEEYYYYDGFGVNLDIGIGPVFRYTPMNNFSLYIRPAIGLNLYTFGTSDYDFYMNFSDVNFLFDLNLGGRSWLVNVSGFHFGLCYGVDLNFGFGSGVVVADGYRACDYEDGYFSSKIYFGLCFNFGDRGLDRF